MSDTPFRIAIVGAGPAGLTLARLLLKSPQAQSLKVAVFEKDASRHSRTSLGGTLDLHTSTGQAALRACGLFEVFGSIARWDGDEIRFCDLNGMCYVHIKEIPKVGDKDQARPEIDREDLRKLLLDGVLGEFEGVVRWGSSLEEVLPGGKLKFVGGQVEGPFDLVVGADGAWSKVRKVLTAVEPAHTGICDIWGSVTKENAGEFWQKMEEMVGKGNHFSFGRGRSAMAQRMGDGTIRVSFNQTKEKGWIERVAKECGRDDGKIKAILRQEYRDWIEEYHSWIKVASNFRCAPVWEHPLGQNRWEHRAGTTLIGDAGTLVSPFAGEGVNKAMKDALDLAKAIENAVAEGKSVDLAIAEFERSTFPSSERIMRRTAASKNGMFAQDAPNSFFRNMTAEGALEVGYDLDKGFMRLIPVRSTVFAVIWIMCQFGSWRRTIRSWLSARNEPAHT